MARKSKSKFQVVAARAFTSREEAMVGADAMRARFRRGEIISATFSPAPVVRIVQRDVRALGSRLTVWVVVGRRKLPAPAPPVSLPFQEEVGEQVPGVGACPHGETMGGCSACDLAADLAYDTAREDRVFGRN